MQLQANILTEEANLDKIKNEQIKHLLTQIFDKNQNNRIKIYDILEDPWVTDYEKEPVNLDLDLGSELDRSSAIFTLETEIKIKDESEETPATPAVISPPSSLFAKRWLI